MAERKKATRRWEKANPEKHQAQIQRARIRHLGLEAQMDRILGLLIEYVACPLCHTPKEKARPHIDHNHRTGQFRGVICQNCNLGIGHFGDDPEVLQAAAVYLSERA